MPLPPLHDVALFLKNIFILHRSNTNRFCCLKVDTPRDDEAEKN